MKITDYIRKKKQDKAMLYIPYLGLGDPQLEQSLDFSLAMLEAGADIIEFGIPFSDPTADGPVIQAAMDRALLANTSLTGIFKLCAKVHKAYPEVPLVFLSYFNVIINGLNFLPTPINIAKEDYDKALADSLSLFLQKCQDCGIQGLVIPDLPFDQNEAQILRRLGEKYDVAHILMVTPNTPLARLEKICQAARGWIYYVSSLGVTGIRSNLPKDLKTNVKNIQELSGLPVFGGFGFHKPEQVRDYKGVLDGIIVGSMNHRIISELESKSSKQIKNDIYGLTNDFVQACLN